MAWRLIHSPHVDHLLGEPWCRKLRRRVAQIKVTDHVVPTVRTSAGYRCCLTGDDQGQPAALHHQLRCGDITATMPKVVDDHLDYGGAPAYLTRCPTNQDGVVIEKAREQRCVTEHAGVLQHCLQVLWRLGTRGHERH
jgi:hypothetical protein